MSRLPVAAGLVLGVLADELLGDPRRGHPVAGFGAAVASLERSLYRDSLAAGATFTLACVLPVTAAAALVERRTARHPAVRTLTVGAATWTVIGGRSLRRIGGELAAALTRGDTQAARALIPSLCGRDPRQLDEDGLARATVESIAENTSDSVIAPLFWGAVAGLPGLLGYRAVNTLDAMVGHRSTRYARFGTAAARLDDLANLVPSRLTAALTVALARQVGGSPAAGYRAWRADAGSHPSPNAGQCEASVAGALGVTLGGPTSYASHTEQRPILGAGRTPQPPDIQRASRLSHLAQYAALAVLVTAVLLRELVDGQASAPRTRAVSA